ncbi:MAG: biotin--[acetyl-CoA-carboxylase] ligase [Thiotrichales bacterium]|nr:biotin--[acetyl-CoA-carboxylase] ligase [Thiotrichales bacterium]
MNLDPKFLHLHPSLQIFHFDSIGSTNLFLKEEIESGRLFQSAFCIADQQTSGYGQHGRQWDSDMKLSPLTCSFAFPIDYGLDVLLLKSIPVALIVRNLLSKNSTQCFQVKWPNDIYNNGRKVSGCLIEVVRSKELKQPFVVFGLGVNLAPDASKVYGSAENLDVVLFLNDLSKALFNFFTSVEGLKAVDVVSEWEKYDYFSVGQKVCVYHSGSSKEGEYLGINSLFQPEIRIDGEVVAFSTGQASIRKV